MSWWSAVQARLLGILHELAQSSVRELQQAAHDRQVAGATRMALSRHACACSSDPSRPTASKPDHHRRDGRIARAKGVKDRAGQVRRPRIGPVPGLRQPGRALGAARQHDASCALFQDAAGDELGVLVADLDEAGVGKETPCTLRWCDQM
jgi:hypothetical protein